MRLFQAMGSREARRGGTTDPPQPVRSESEVPAPERAGSIPLEEARCIRRMIRGLERHSPVRGMAEAILAGRPKPLAAILPIFQELAERPGLRWREQEIAAWSLGRVPLQPVQKRVAAEALLPLIEPGWGLDLFGRTSIALSRLILVSLPITIWVCNLDGLMNYSQRSVTWYDPLMMVFYSLVVSGLLLPVVLPLSAFFEDKQRNRVRARAITSLGQLGVPHGLEGTLAALLETSKMAMASTSKRVRNAALEAFPAMVAALTPEHYGRMSLQTVPNLCQVLNSPEERLALLALQALALVGDGRAIPSVKRLIEKGRTPELRAVASAILPELERRQAEENAPRQLLRATSAPETPAHLLLRPSAEKAGGDPGLLLRPGERS